jgi:hypothetical protein
MTNAQTTIRRLAKEAGPFYRDDWPHDVFHDLRDIQGDLVGDDEMFTVEDVIAYLEGRPA